MAAMTTSTALPTSVPARTPTSCPTASAVSTQARSGRACATPLLVSLDREWARTSRRPSAMRRARTWPDLVAAPDLARALADVTDRCRSLDDLVDATQRDAVRTRSGPHPDLVLAALVVAARHDDVAGQVLVRRILPGVISQSRRYASGDDVDERVAQAIGAAWIAIRSFDVERRPRAIAAALISDAMWSAFRRASRRRSAGEIPSPDEVFVRRAAPSDDVDPLVGLAATVRAAETAGAGDGHLELIRDLVRAGTPSELARRRCVTPRTIRNHRDSAVAEIRRVLGPDWTDGDVRLSAVA